MRRKYDKGFTLVEVMVAMVVVTIISTPLLQMFVTTSYSNKNAQLMDIVNNITVQQAEKFKAAIAALNPGSYNAQTVYCNAAGNILTNSTGAAIEVVSVVNSPSPVPSLSGVSYYPNVVETFTLTNDYVVKIIEYTDTTDPNNIIITSYEVDVTDEDNNPIISPLTISPTTINNNILPIGVDFNFGTNLRTINLTNNSNLEVSFYVLNAMLNTDQSAPQLVTINSSQGSASLYYVPSANSQNQNYQYTLDLIVKKTDPSGEWQEISRSSYSDSDLAPQDKSSSIYGLDLTH